MINMDCPFGILFVFVFFIIVLLAFVSYYRQSKELDEVEFGKTPLYSEQMGAWFTFGGYTKPFVRVSAYEGFFVVSCREDKYIFTKENVSELFFKDSFLSKQIIIYHSREYSPRKIILRPRNLERMYQALKTSLGGSKLTWPSRWI